MRGQLNISLTTILEVLVVVAIIGVATLIAIRVYPLFFDTTNKQTLHANDQIVRNIDTLIEEDTEEYRFIFQFNEREDFKGNIYAINANGELSDPFPPVMNVVGAAGTAVNHYTKQIDALLAKAKVSVDGKELQNARCSGKACLCFTAKQLPEFHTADFNSGVDVEVFTRIYTGKATCNSYDDITFSIQPYSTVFNAGFKETVGIDAKKAYDLVLTKDSTTIGLAIGTIGEAS